MLSSRPHPLHQHYLLEFRTSTAEINDTKTNCVLTISKQTNTCDILPHGMHAWHSICHGVFCFVAFVCSTHLCTHTRLTALCPGLSGWAGTRKVKTNLDFTEARDSEWQWQQLGHMQVCTSLQTDKHASTPPLSFFTGRMPFLPPNQQCQSTEDLCTVPK